MLLLRLAVVWILAGVIMLLTGCGMILPQGGRVYMGYETVSEIKKTEITNPDERTGADWLWHWMTDGFKDKPKNKGA